MATKQIHFWKTMQYRCGRCGDLIVMALEDGCEGPRDKEVPFRFGKGHPLEGREGVLAVTAGGRGVIPVPFTIACRCGQNGAYRSHANWGQDQPIDLTVDLPYDEPHFRYDPSENPDACGIPVGHRLELRSKEDGSHR